MADDEIHLWADFDVTQLSDSINEEITVNSLKLPLLYNSQHPKFVALPHLYSVYYDSYKCILCGFYHPGIMLLGQLVEITVNEILLVHDNVQNQGTFTYAIKYAENANGKMRKCSKKPFFPKFIIDSLKRVLEIRDCYTHLNYKKLFKDSKIKVYGFHVGDTFEEQLQTVNTVVTKLSNGEIQYSEIDVAFDKSIADMTKRKYDPEWAREWAWKIYPFFEFLVEEYLMVADYQEHIRIYGSAFDAIPITDDNL
ncbi:MAG: hypothetical protein WC367_04255 [Methanoregula sp.]|jgi:hypothetical protein